MWDRTLDGRTLRFRLFGINNQNFIMRDDETGSWWQQVTGEAIQGPLRGRRLRPVAHDEVALRVFREENPNGRVLLPVPGMEEEYASSGWEKRMKKVATVTQRVAGEPLEPRTVVVGIAAGGQARAWPFPLLRRQSPLLDSVGGLPVALVVGDDGKSIRAFDRRVDGRSLELSAVAGADPLRLVDVQTGSEWDFAGRALSGPLAGRRLSRLRALKEYWFDWRTYNPATTVYLRGASAVGLAPPAAR